MRLVELLEGVIIHETSTAGATGAGSVATAVGALGAGFDPDGDWRSIYPKNKQKKQNKPIVIKRNMPGSS